MYLKGIPRTCPNARFFDALGGVGRAPDACAAGGGGPESPPGMYSTGPTPVDNARILLQRTARHPV